MHWTREYCYSVRDNRMEKKRVKNLLNLLVPAEELKYENQVKTLSEKWRTIFFLFVSFFVV